ncbi:MAG: hypothetical protein ISS36_02510 [Candidatus Aenigmarchaeota archaeon]|nr:hypothetical protein [Candidatus Aenigmarchaeota archaeon]
MLTGEEVTILRKDYKINYIKPCKTDSDKRMAEANLLNFKMDCKDMYDILKKSGLFGTVKLSEKINTVRAENPGSVTIFDTGKLSFKRMEEGMVLDLVDGLNMLLRKI